jgi:hypothetical protein
MMMALGNKTHLKPPAHAAVFCVDEKSAIQALDRPIQFCPFRPGVPSATALSISGMARSRSTPPWRFPAERSWAKPPSATPSAEFVAVLAAVVATQAEGKQIHVIADNLSAHKTKAVAEFLAAHPNTQLHYTRLALLGSIRSKSGSPKFNAI